MIAKNKKFNILIIEDTPMQMRILNLILSPLYNVRVARDGEKGLQLAEKYEVDLILLDIIMEGMSGFEVLDALKKSDKTKNIPVIFITSMDSSESEIKGLAAGAVDYITKPFVNEVVLLRVGLHIKLISQMQFIEQSTLYDSLTGIYNRHSFNITLNREWERSIEAGQCISLIMLDIDHFKSFNDNYGHLSGDDCLITVAHALKIRDFDTVFRWGGEEFAVLLPGMSLADSEGVAERLRRVVEKKRIEYAKGKSTNVTISLGVGTIYPNVNDKSQDFCWEVDKMLYKAKENGRNRVESTLL